MADTDRIESTLILPLLTRTDYDLDFRWTGQPRLDHTDPGRLSSLENPAVR